MSQNTPESDVGSIECFQNYTASEVFVQGLAGIVDQQDVQSMIRAQKQMLQRFEKTNEMLTNCNALSSNRFKLASTEFKKHMTLLLGMKKDLNYIFKKVRIIKERLATSYPTAYNEACKEHSKINEDDEEETKLKDTNDTMEKEIPEFATSSSDDATNSNKGDDSSPCSSDTG
ncbi:UNVERIFIED_CONTAM: hypothetical protein PYX00_008671 [Menopon gallinae]|uniref:KxDL domain-containing protein n=1 Tax=Menopon gallinae TaxID=328185 RepID=A0AAW2HPA7_9NEOP